MRWLWRGLAGVALLFLLILTPLYAVSSAELGRQWPTEKVALVSAGDPGAVARGARLARLFGCVDCHGADLRGSKYFDDPMIARLWSANLTLLTPTWSDADFASVLRTGVSPQGRGLINMPSFALQRMNDQEIADVVAYLRGLPVGGPVRHRPSVGPIGRVGLITRQYQTQPAMVADARRRPLPDFGPAFAQGRSLARTCAECHGADLKGDKMIPAPDLLIAASYSQGDFEHLLRTGIATNHRRLPLMSESAPKRFNVLTHDEIAALHAYLLKRAERTR